MEIKCKLLKRGFIDHYDYTIFTTTINKIAENKLFNINETYDFHLNHKSTALVIDCCWSSDYKIDGDKLILNKIIIASGEPSQFLGLVNLYNKAEGLIKEQIGQLGVTFIIDLVSKEKIDNVLENTMVLENNFEEAF